MKRCQLYLCLQYDSFKSSAQIIFTPSTSSSPVVPFSCTPFLGRLSRTQESFSPNFFPSPPLHAPFFLPTPSPPACPTFLALLLFQRLPQALKSLRILRFIKLTRLLKGTKLIREIDPDTRDKVEDVMQVLIFKFCATPVEASIFLLGRPLRPKLAVSERMTRCPSSAM